MGLIAAGGGYSICVASTGGVCGVAGAIALFSGALSLNTLVDGETGFNVLERAIGEPLLVTAEVVEVATNPVKKGVDRLLLHPERTSTLAERFGDFGDVVLAGMGADAKDD